MSGSLHHLHSAMRIRVRVRGSLAGGIALVLLLAAPVARAWTLTSLPYQRVISIDNTAGSETLVGYAVRIQLAAPDFDFSAACPDGADLRFRDLAGTSELPYWIESWDGAGGSGVVWVRIPEIPAGGTAQVLMLYGDPAAAAASDGGATFLFHDGFEDFAADGMNAPAPLVTPTYDGSGQVVHPDVVHVEGGWHGYEYWLAMTPYPNGNDDYENPSVIVSNDNVTWSEPPGLTNPLAPFVNGVLADADLLLVADTLRLYFNETNNDGQGHVCLLTSADGVTWEGPQTCLTVPNYMMCPTVLYEDGAYVLWYLRSPTGCTSSYQDVFLRTSADGLTWTAEQEVTIPHPGHVVWHFDIQRDGDRYVMVYAAYPEGSNCSNTRLYLAESDDRFHWTVNETPLLSPVPGSWDSAQIYRSSFLVDGSWLRIWYSARSTSGQWHVGYTEGDLEDFLGDQASTWDLIQGDVHPVEEPVRTGSQALAMTGGSPYPLVAEATSGRVCASAWFYDDMATTSNLLSVLRLYAGEEEPLPCIGVGLWTGISTTHYAFHSTGYQYTAAAIPRSPGWHELAARTGESTCKLLIDDQVVVELADLEVGAISRFSLGGYLGGTTWYDDVHVRPCASPEPLVSVGPEETTGMPDDPDAPPGRPDLLPQVSGHPNPFNPRVAIDLSLPVSGPARLTVHDLQGRCLITLMSGVLEAGRHSLIWDGCDRTGEPVAAGVYLVHLRAPSGRASAKLLLAR
jgi:predicted GH43/DUF377 family glycosyl hydrolase